MKNTEYNRPIKGPVKALSEFSCMIIELVLFQVAVIIIRNWMF